MKSMRKIWLAGTLVATASAAANDYPTFDCDNARPSTAVRVAGALDNGSDLYTHAQPIFGWRAIRSITSRKVPNDDSTCIGSLGIARAAAKLAHENMVGQSNFGDVMQGSARCDRRNHRSAGQLRRRCNRFGNSAAQCRRARVREATGPSRSSSSASAVAPSQLVMTRQHMISDGG